MIYFNDKKKKHPILLFIIFALSCNDWLSETSNCKIFALFFFSLFLEVWNDKFRNDEVCCECYSMIIPFTRWPRLNCMFFFRALSLRLSYRTKIQTTNKLWFEGSILRKWREKRYKMIIRHLRSSESPPSNLIYHLLISS